MALLQILACALGVETAALTLLVMCHSLGRGLVCTSMSYRFTACLNNSICNSSQTLRCHRSSYKSLLQVPRGNKICYKTLISKSLMVNAVPRWEFTADEVSGRMRDSFVILKQHHKMLEGPGKPSILNSCQLSIHCPPSVFIPEVCVGSRYSPLLICLMRFL